MVVLAVRADPPLPQPRQTEHQLAAGWFQGSVEALDQRRHTGTPRSLAIRCFSAADFSIIARSARFRHCNPALPPSCGRFYRRAGGRPEEMMRTIRIYAMRKQESDDPSICRQGRPRLDNRPCNRSTGSPLLATQPPSIEIGAPVIVFAPYGAQKRPPSAQSPKVLVENCARGAFRSQRMGLVFDRRALLRPDANAFYTNGPSNTHPGRSRWTRHSVVPRVRIAGDLGHYRTPCFAGT